ncbi:hypothetical protein pah_c016o115 [Parachlamydia acanthamoebae str. Hall's coccus]|nr:hypothetical protein pah_c016o115 [Parachlamydia acanthamoebae str. Hall's coccus]
MQSLDENQSLTFSDESVFWKFVNGETLYKGTIHLRSQEGHARLKSFGEKRG